MLGDLDEALFAFYAGLLQNVSSLDELNRFLAGHEGPEILCVREEQLTGGRDLTLDAAAFPESVDMAGQPVAVSYAYAPGEEWDGVTLRLPLDVARTVTASAVDWAVPSLRVELVAELLGSLPKAHRRVLQPFAPKVEEIVRDLVPQGPTLLHDLSRFVRERYGVPVSVTDWRAEAVPAHLRPRVEVVSGDARAKAVASGRDLSRVRVALAEIKARPVDDSALWRRATERWERGGLSQWSFGDLPEQVPVGEVNGLPVVAWPGLKVEDGAVSVRLFRSREAARTDSLPGLQRLVELALGKDLAWLERDLRGLQKYAQAFAPLGRIEELVESAMRHLRRHVLPSEPISPLREAAFREAVRAAQARLPGLSQHLMDRVGIVLNARAQAQQKVGVPAAPRLTAAGAKAAPPRGLALKDFSQLSALAVPGAAATPSTAAGSGQVAAPSMAAELAALVPPDFLDRTPFERLPHLARYLRALQIRAERAALNPAKDRERAGQLTPYLAALARVRATREFSEEGRRLADEFRWMIEEFKVSIFAQEVGTAAPVSAKRLDALWERLKLECS